MDKIVFVLVLSAIFLAGCTTAGPAGGFDLEEIKSMVDDPNVEIASENFSAEQMQEKLAELNPKCGNKLSAKPYSAIYVTSSQVDLTLFVDVELDEIVCTIKTEKAADECVTDADCDDGLSSTVDSCGGVPRVCSNERIQECISDDSYCPKKCTKEVDSDCTRECLEDADCDDANVLTSDSCSGLVKVCLNVPIVVEGKALESCETDTDCDDENPCTIDACSEETCSYTNEVNGTTCGLKLECFDGACVNVAENQIKISGFEIKALSENSVELTWKTNKLGKSAVKYGLDITYQKSKSSNKNVIDHKIVLDGLSRSKKYYYKIESEDQAGLSIGVYQPINNAFFTCSGCESGQSCDITTGQCT